MRTLRNFSIIAHIDHGKSTLADRFLEITQTIPKDKLDAQHLDSMDLEKEKGITIKLAPVTMHYRSKDSEVVLNLIDTPGHVDFSYEVSRSLSCVEGTILLVDATKGIEAQTLSNYLLASSQNLKIIPAINKIDMENAQTQEVKKQLVESLGFHDDEIFLLSAKTGEGVENLLKAVVEKVPPPAETKDKSTTALVFDSFYDTYKGVVAYVRVFDGKIKKGDKIKFLGTNTETESSSVGFFAPKLTEKESLESGEIGWVATGLKEVQRVRVGDTIGLSGESIEALPGYKEFKSMVFAGIFPTNRDEFPQLKEALEKLKLNDASLVYEPENSPALGFGVRAGFLGLLHMEIVQERLEREFGLSLILSSPTVRYKVERTNGEQIEVSNPSELPERNLIKEISEPWVSSSIVSVKNFVGPITQVLYEHRAEIQNIEYFGDKVNITALLPLAEIISKFYDQLKTVSSGFASFDYDFADYKSVDAVRLDILIAKESVDALSQIVVKNKAYNNGKALVEKLKEVIPRQQFEVSIQAAVGGKIVAAEKVAAFRKDVTAKLYGGDRTRKDKLLEKQKAGKKRMKMVGSIEIPQEAFLAVLKI